MDGISSWTGSLGIKFIFRSTVRNENSKLPSRPAREGLRCINVAVTTTTICTPNRRPTQGYLVIGSALLWGNSIGTSRQPTAFSRSRYICLFPPVPPTPDTSLHPLSTYSSAERELDRVLSRSNTISTTPSSPSPRSRSSQKHPPAHQPTLPAVPLP